MEQLGSLKQVSRVKALHTVIRVARSRLEEYSATVYLNES